MKEKSNYILGVLGGVGPLASAKFIESIYKTQSKIVHVEQEHSQVFLYSDPSMPDRTAYFSQGLKQDLFVRLTQNLYKLLEMGVDEIVVCCYTLHHILSDLPQDLIQKIVSLPCLALFEVIRLKKKSLLLCSSGAMRLKVFEHSPFWPDAQNYIVKPDDDDQRCIHQTIYQLKRNSGHVEAFQLLKNMQKKYEVDTWIAGCTEFHLLSAELHFSSKRSVDFDAGIDPLLMIADRMAHERCAKG
ncbi:MAG: aspartate/glutamate racemase family protein [Gammaproteobacteria bacterium]|nr:aspartate/glutamate racemase family protein [Gammaproteobacteria bacterium]